jgi:hypothetical protein
MISGQIDLEDLTEPEALVELHWDALRRSGRGPASSGPGR